MVRILESLYSSARFTDIIIELLIDHTLSLTYVEILATCANQVGNLVGGICWICLCRLEAFPEVVVVKGCHESNQSWSKRGCMLQICFDLE